MGEPARDATNKHARTDKTDDWDARHAQRRVIIKTDDGFKAVDQEGGDCPEREPRTSRDDGQTSKGPGVTAGSARPAPADVEAMCAELRQHAINSGFGAVEADWRNEAAALLRSIAAERDAAQAKVAEAKAIISKCLAAINNGGFASPECSLEFMSGIPAEIGLHVASLVEDRDAWKERADAAQAEAARLREAIEKARAKSEPGLNAAKSRAKQRFSELGWDQKQPAPPQGVREGGGE